MFKSKDTKAKPAPPPAPTAAPAPARDPELEQAERDLARLTRIKNMGAEAEMWRKFADGCKPGRWFFEDHHMTFYLSDPNAPSRLSTTMDEDSAPLWKAFALSMAEERQRRMRDLLACR